MGLQDRDYMRMSPEESNESSGMGMLWGLIIVNAVMYFVAAPGSPLYRDLALYCVSGNFHVYQLATAGFLHYDFWHILFNMYGLYIFGKLVAPHLGGRRFLIMYLHGLLYGNLLFLALNWNARISLVGASGAVCAVMMPGIRRASTREEAP